MPNNNNNNLANALPEQPTFNGCLRLARLTSDKGPLTKVFSLNKDGGLDKSTVATLSRGSVENLNLANFDDFLEALPTLQSNQVLTYGVSPLGDGLIYSEEIWNDRGRPAGAWPRDRKHFGWPSSGGILMLDYDPPKDGAAMGREELLAILYGVAPGLEEAAHVWWPSASSLIFDKETDKELAGVRGQRIYIWVADAQDIERTGKALAGRLLCQQ